MVPHLEEFMVAAAVAAVAPTTPAVVVVVVVILQVLFLPLKMNWKGKKQDQLKRIAEPDTREYISKSIEGEMLEERVRIDKEVNEGRPKAGGHLGQMKEMMRALHNHELGNNEEFIEDLMELNERITGKDKRLRYGSGHKLTTESTHQIAEDILKLWRKYLDFKSAMYVHTPEYAAIHKQILKEKGKGKGN